MGSRHLSASNSQLLPICQAPLTTEPQQPLFFNGKYRDKNMLHPFSLLRAGVSKPQPGVQMQPMESPNMAHGKTPASSSGSSLAISLIHLALLPKSVDTSGLEHDFLNLGLSGCLHQGRNTLPKFPASKRIRFGWVLMSDSFVFLSIHIDVPFITNHVILVLPGLGEGKKEPGREQDLQPLNK